MRRAVVTHSVRTPIGRFLGQFRDLTAVDLGTTAVEGLLASSGMNPEEVDQVLLGIGRQAGVGPNPARQVGIRAGLPEAVPAVTINMACGSGLLTLVQAARMIALGEAECVVTGGMESMTNVPFMLPRGRLGYRLGHGKMVDGMYLDGFDCPLAEQVMGETAETLARKYSIERAEQDAYAARSQNRAEEAIRDGRFKAEIIPVETRDRKGNVTAHELDEHPRSGITAEGLAGLPAVFDRESGTVTAGNSSGITDGAAALLVMSEEGARGRGFEPLAVIEGWESAGVNPKIMGVGPVPAVTRLNERLGRTVRSYDLVELNEAFAAQVLACDRELKFDHDRLNVNGGAIALGHPIGCTGARIATTLLHEMARREANLGLATLCISGGLGLAVSFSR